MDLDFQYLGGAGDGAVGRGGEGFFAEGRAAGTMKMTSSVMSVSTVAASPALLADIQRSTKSRIAFSSSLIDVSRISFAPNQFP